MPVFQVTQSIFELSMQYSIRFPTGEVQYNFNGFATAIAGFVDKSQTIIITDEKCEQAVRKAV